MFPRKKKDEFHLRRAGHYVPRNNFTRSLIKKLEQLLSEFKQLSLFEKIEKIGALSVLIVFIYQIPRISNLSKIKEQEIFAAWQVLKNSQGSQSEVPRLALERLNKEGFSLSGINVEKTNLTKIKLNDANLSKAKLSGTSLNGTRFSGANFSNPTLIKANFKGNIWVCNRNCLTIADFIYNFYYAAFKKNSIFVLFLSKFYLLS